MPSTALCDPEAFYPFRSLVEGPLDDPEDLPKIERFVRSVVLHDEMKMLMVPWPDPGELHEWTPEEIAAGGRNVLVAIGPDIRRWEEHHIIVYAEGADVPEALQLSPEQLRLAAERADANEGPYFRANTKYIRTLAATVRAGGSIVCESDLPANVVNVASRIPANLLGRLAPEWEKLVRETDQGNIGLVVPPFLAILLNRCARRDAIPAALADMKHDFRQARERVWELIAARSRAQTIQEAAVLTRELERAGELMNPNMAWPAFSPVRTLWQIGAATVGGAAVGALGGEPAVGAAAAAIYQAANAICEAELDFRIIFRAGAFDLARRVNHDLRQIPRMPELLGPILTDAERAALGMH